MYIAGPSCLKDAAVGVIPERPGSIDLRSEGYYRSYFYSSCFPAIINRNSHAVPTVVRLPIITSARSLALAANGAKTIGCRLGTATTAGTGWTHYLTKNMSRGEGRASLERTIIISLGSEASGDAEMHVAAYHLSAGTHGFIACSETTLS